MSGERLTVVEKALLHMTTPVASASDVADAVQERSDALEDAGDPRREVLDDLRLLERSGDVHSRKVGARARAWWHEERVVPAPPEDPADHPDQADLEDASEPHPEPSPEPEPAPEPAPIDAGPDDLREQVHEWFDDADGSEVPQARAAREALATLAVLLDERGTARTREIRSAVYERHGDEYGTEKAMWASIQPFFEVFPFVSDPGRGEWAPARP